MINIVTLFTFIFCILYVLYEIIHIINCFIFTKKYNIGKRIFIAWFSIAYIITYLII